MKKRVLSFVLIIVMAISIFSTIAFAATSGSCGKNLAWTLENGVLTISGTGDMENYSYLNVPWNDNRPSIKSVIIENGVTSIGSYAFYNCLTLTSVSIPDSITKIGNDAFQWCSKLETVTITDIDAWCNIDFSNADSNPLYYANDFYLNGEKVANLVIPDTVTTIKDYTFYNCNDLTSITIGNSVTSIGSSAFYGCYNLKLVNINDISAWCNIDFKNEFSNPLYYAIFLYLNKEEVTNLIIPKTVVAIKRYAFSYCYSITNVSIENGVTNIGDRAFAGCAALKSVSIPNSVTNINDYAFIGCSGLASINLPDSVTAIGSHAFERCEKLTSITIPNSVTTIGDYAFSGCSNLTDVALPNGITSISDSMFESCDNLESISIPDSIQNIGKYAFEWCNIKKLIISNGSKKITTIMTEPFLTQVTDIVIPTSVVSVEELAFIDFTTLKNVWYEGTQSERANLSISAYNKYLENATWHYKCEQHTFGEYVYNNDASTEKDGTKTAKCNNCNVTDTITAEGTKIPTDKPIIDSTKQFKDVPRGKWYVEAINYAVTYGIFTGTSETTFEPNKNMTRAQFVQVFANLAGTDTSDHNVDSGFTDVPKGKWFTGAVTWAAKNGVVNGIGDGKFDSNADVTRQQMCVMIVNFVENFMNNSLKQDKNVSSFADDKDIAKWAKEQVYKCAKAGLINGVGDNKFDPKSSATRAQGATIFTNFHKAYLAK